MNKINKLALFPLTAAAVVASPLAAHAQNVTDKPVVNVKQDLSSAKRMTAIAGTGVADLVANHSAQVNKPYNQLTQAEVKKHIDARFGTYITFVGYTPKIGKLDVVFKETNCVALIGFQPAAVGTAGNPVSVGSCDKNTARTPLNSTQSALEKKAAQYAKIIQGYSAMVEKPYNKITAKQVFKEIAREEGSSSVQVTGWKYGKLTAKSVHLGLNCTFSVKFDTKGQGTSGKEYAKCVNVK